MPCLLLHHLCSSRLPVYLLAILSMASSILILSPIISLLFLLKPFQLSMSSFFICLKLIRTLLGDEH